MEVSLIWVEACLHPMPMTVLIEHFLLILRHPQTPLKFKLISCLGFDVLFIMYYVNKIEKEL